MVVQLPCNLARLAHMCTPVGTGQKQSGRIHTPTEGIMYAMRRMQQSLHVRVPLQRSLGAGAGTYFDADVPRILVMNQNKWPAHMHLHSRNCVSLRTSMLHTHDAVTIRVSVLHPRTARTCTWHVVGSIVPAASPSSAGSCRCLHLCAQDKARPWAQERQSTRP